MSARHKLRGASAVLLAAVLAGGLAPASAAVCKMHLRVELTPDVPVPLESGFLSSLLSNRVSYRLTLLALQPGSIMVAELTGPGPEYRCRNVVETMRRDGRILSVHIERGSATPPVGGQVPRRTLDLRPPGLQSLDVAALQPIETPTDSEEAEAVTIAAAPLLAEEEPDGQRSPGGFAALYWAGRHPTQAWRIFLPLPVAADTPHGGGGFDTGASRVAHVKGSALSRNRLKDDRSLAHGSNKASPPPRAA
jgi:hypothetical protein